jgi:hypothetical protein
VVEPLRPARGGFLRPFGYGQFIREFLLGHGPYGSQNVDPNVGAPQADIFRHDKRTGNSHLGQTGQAGNPLRPWRELP